TLPVNASPSLICSGNTSMIVVTGSQLGVSYQLRNNADNSAIGGPVAGTGGDINLPTGALTANTTFNVLATQGSCTAQLLGLPSVTIRAPGDPFCSGGGGINCSVFTVTINDTRPSCTDQDDGSIEIAVTGGTGGY